MNLADLQTKIEEILLSTMEDYDPNLSNGLALDQALALDMFATAITRMAWQPHAKPAAWSLVAQCRVLRDLIINRGLQFKRSPKEFWSVYDKKGYFIGGSYDFETVIDFIVGQKEPPLHVYLPGIRLPHGGIYSNGHTHYPENLT